MIDKICAIEDIADQVESGMTLAIGGWGARRKPMAVIRELLKREVSDLTVLSYGGPDVGMLAATGKIKKLIFGFVTMDAIPLEGHFRKARQSGEFEVVELDEGMFQLGLKAAASRVPFLPTRVGFGSDVLTTNAELKTVKSPYEDGEELVAMPALSADIAICHVNQADKLGNSRISGPDPFFDEWFCRAAGNAFLTCEEVVETETFNDPLTALQMPIERNLVSGVAEAPCGAHPTSCGPAYGFDIAHLKRYNETAKDGFESYRQNYVDGMNLPGYIEAVGGEDAVRSLPLPVF